ncbi:MAG: SUF system Fe-S cluster assembly protein [Phaeodactylibacter sp.]|nr:SUF system Fe-S cluster assembly protein [Phaeodactylibacter sp.]MCB9264689.1 SUF system Fe-S cluster assembly protein [Lewinellaceae bacterium]MCB9287100.1 SUF system Fe-S cluster assembly protein [Lewinellaceae bacterium]
MSEPKSELEQRIIEALKTVYDPEIPVDIYELGLVYKIDILKDGKVEITMTLTSPMCPVAESLPMEVQQKVWEVDGVSEVSLNVVYDPPWSKDMMSEEARFALDMF